jgi:hypothetical protein
MTNRHKQQLALGTKSGELVIMKRGKESNYSRGQGRSRTNSHWGLEGRETFKNRSHWDGRKVSSSLLALSPR